MIREIRDAMKRAEHKKTQWRRVKGLIAVFFPTFGLSWHLLGSIQDPGVQVLAASCLTIMATGLSAFWLRSRLLNHAKTQAFLTEKRVSKGPALLAIPAGSQRDTNAPKRLAKR